MAFYALIMAGGGGTRLWPLSRKDRPKQALALTTERTLFQITVDRLDGLISPDRIFVVTGRTLVENLSASAPSIPKENYIVEPSAKDSGPAAGLGIYHIAHRDPEAVIAILSADHHIADEARFRDSLVLAKEYALQSKIVTLGIDPSFPATGFGYIQRGDLIGSDNGLKVYQAVRFTEKPPLERAMEFLASGTYSWNAGIFILSAAEAIREFERQQPATAAALADVTQHPDHLESGWAGIKKISIDFAIMENAQHMVIIPVSIGWSDVGTWATLYEVLAQDINGNAQRSNTNDHIQIDTKRTLIVGDKLVVTIGVEDLVIVDTDDALLICSRDRAQDVKEVVDQLKARSDQRI